MFHYTGIVFGLLFVGLVDGDLTIKYSTGCTVTECNPVGADDGNNQTCSGATRCYKLDTTRNTSICAPPIVCSMFESCINNSRSCASNSSVCVVNSCCDKPICIPLILTEVCTRYESPSTPIWSTRLCQNATWSTPPRTIFESYNVNYQYLTIRDFVFEKNGSILALSSSNSRIVRLSTNNNWTSTIVTNIISDDNIAQIMALDSNGTVYVTQQSNSYGYGYYNQYRIVRYPTNRINGTGTIIYGPTSCGTALSEICSAGGFLIDPTGAMYYSDSTNHRVLKIQPFATSATIVAGISGSAGSSLNQLNSPGVLFLDNARNLYVSDYGNYRILKFSPDRTTGVILFSTSWNQGISAMFIDATGSVLASTPTSLIRWFPQWNGYITLMGLSQNGFSRLSMDRFGNLFGLISSGSNLLEYDLISNYC